MARYPQAEWDPISGPAGDFTGGPFKVVHHKTEGDSLTGARAAFKANKSDPHFTVHGAGVHQHVDTAYASRSLRNAVGGVETGRDSAIQIEVVGRSGRSSDDATLNNLVGLIKWLDHVHIIPWVWPEGRPPLSSADGYGLSNGHRHPLVWDRQGGHYGHSQVPENTHWDPAYTDREWWILCARLNPPAPPAALLPLPSEEDDVLPPVLVEMPAANALGLAEKFVDFGHEVLPVSLVPHGPNPSTDGWWPDTASADFRAQPHGTGLVVTVGNVKAGAKASVWVTVR